MTFPVVESSATQEFTEATSFAVTLPTGILSGDTIYLFIATGGVSVNTPSGYSLVVSGGSPDFGVVFERTSDGSEGSSVVLTTGSGEVLAVVSLRVSGVKAGAIGSVNQSNDSLQSANVDPSYTNPCECLAVLFVGMQANRVVVDQTYFAASLLTASPSANSADQMAALGYRSVIAKDSRVVAGAVTQNASTNAFAIGLLIPGDDISGGVSSPVTLLQASAIPG